MPRNTRPKDYFSFLLELEKKGQPWFLEGGQAVNFWAEYYLKNGIANEALLEHEPFTSQDCDIWVSPSAFRCIKEDSGDELLLGVSPSDGQLGIFQLQDQPKRNIDLLSNVHGLDVSICPVLYERALEFKGIHVLDPLYLFKSKCHCFIGLNQSGRQDRKHLRMLALIIPAFFVDLLRRTKAAQISERQLIKEVKLFRDFTKSNPVRQALSQLDLAIDDLIPVGEFRSTPLQTVQKFAKTTWPDPG